MELSAAEAADECGRDHDFFCIERVRRAEFLDENVLRRPRPRSPS